MVVASVVIATRSELVALDKPLCAPLIDRVAVIEANHFYDEAGRHVFDQHIYYDACPDTGALRLRDWRLIKSGSQNCYRAPGGMIVSTWWDDGILRQVQAPEFRETWTQYDPELADRAEWPPEFRRGLTKRSLQVDRSWPLP